MLEPLARLVIGTPERGYIFAHPKLPVLLRASDRSGTRQAGTAPGGLDETGGGRPEQRALPTERYPGLRRALRHRHLERAKEPLAAYRPLLATKAWAEA